MGKGVKDMVHIDYMMPFENGSFHAHSLNFLEKKIPSPKIKNYSLLVILCKFFYQHMLEIAVCVCAEGVNGSERIFQEYFKKWI